MINTHSIILRVTFGARQDKGGVVFRGIEVNPYTLSKTPNKQIYLVHVDDNDHNPLVELIHRGMFINVIPKTRFKLRTNIGQERFSITTEQIEFLRPHADQIIDFLGKNSLFQGIGPTKARNLWEFFGEELYTLLDTGDIQALCSIISKETAQKAINAWRIYANSDAMNYCNSVLNLKISTSLRISAYYRSETYQRLKEDPYRLLAFGVSFNECDKIVQLQGLNIDSNLRLSAAVEEALYMILANGSTVAFRDELINPLGEILYPTNNLKITNKHQNNNELEKENQNSTINQALNANYESVNYVLIEKDLYQSNGAFIMESCIAEYLITNINKPIHSTLSEAIINETIREYEHHNCFKLTNGQVDAILKAYNHRFITISGSAGVGKTTVLDALYQIFKKAGITPIQLAVTGKAAKRMTEATGHKASTIAKFILSFDFKRYEKTELAIVIDESSMIDLPSFYRLVTFIPKGTRILLLGDTSQLPPIDAGLVFHELVKLDFVPNALLGEVCRQTTGSNIPFVANNVRDGVLPDLTGYKDIQYISADFSSIKKLAVDMYLQAPTSAQIICPTNKMADAINTLCSSANKKANIRIFVDEFDTCMDTEFREGDKVMCSKNIYKINIMNGSIGVITKAYKDEKIIPTDDDSNTEEPLSFGRILWDDGIEREISVEVIEALQLAYAITIHKSQGSEFERVIISLERAPNLDRAMLYTAITRARNEVIMIGDNSVLTKALRTEYSATRKVDLGKKMEHFHKTRFK